MSDAFLIIGILGFGAAAALAEADNAATGRVMKMAASTGVILLLLGGTGGSWEAYAVWVLAALALSWVGDLALSFAGRAPFVVGLVAFALAHVAYVVAFAVRGGWSMPLLAIGAVAMAVFSVAILRWLGPHRPEELRWPIAAYVVIIGVMVAASFATLGSDPDPRIPTAAVLFAASDVFVARQRFVEPSRANRLIGLPLYFLAQILFALSAS